MIVNFVLVVVGGSFGATLRYGTYRTVAKLIPHTATPGRFAWATWTVNVVGCLLAGLVAGAGLGTELNMLIITGICGGYTTLSTHSYDIWQLVAVRKLLIAQATLVGTFAASLISVIGGWYLATAW